jgi:outer membrane protein OmpA-like peptidoglycan-associated protein
LGEVNNAQRLSVPFKIMKLAKLAYLPAVGLALSLTVVGCKKGLDKTTQIPNQKMGVPTDTATGPRDPGQGGIVPPPVNNTGTGVTGTEPVGVKDGGIAAAKGDFSNWKENREEFAAQTVHFDFDKANVKPGEVGKLEEVARRMKANFQGKALRIEGHCDERGTEEYNRALGDKRALSVREKLVALGLDPEMLPTITFGEEKPADAGHTEAAWAKNRRAELILLSPP